MHKMSELMAIHGPKIILGTAVIGITVFLAFVIRSVLGRVFNRFVWAPRVGSLISATAFFAILIFGILTGLGTMGLNMMPIIASLGLGGFAIGFAFKDVLSNLLAGVLVIVYQPFVKGDTLTVSGCEGKVVEINLRYTVLENESTRFMVPNSLILTNPLKIGR